MSEKTKFSIGDLVVYTYPCRGIICAPITSIKICDEGIKIYDDEASGFLFEHDVHFATRCNVDMLAQELIDNIKKDAREIKEKYCEEIRPLYCCDCGLLACGCKR